MKKTSTVTAGVECAEPPKYACHTGQNLAIIFTATTASKVMSKNVRMRRMRAERSKGGSALSAG